MEMKQCAQGGHYYDADLHIECPYCKNSNIGATIPLDPKSVALGGVVNQPAAAQNSDDGKTVALYKSEAGIDPAVGWLVCLEGAEKGVDFRLHSENNFIGRNAKMDVHIKSDSSISRENYAAIVSYDSRGKIFYLSPGEGRSIVRHNDGALFATAKLTAYDVVEVGQTKLMFIPFCGEKFDWA